MQMQLATLQSLSYVSGPHRPLADNFVDMDPDGMDWSEFTPIQHKANYNKHQHIHKNGDMEAQQREMGRLREQEGQLDYHRRSRGGQIGDKGTVESSRRGSSSRRPSGDTYDYSNFSGDGYDDFSRGGTEYHDGYVGDDGHSYYSDRDGGSIYDIEGQEHQQYHHHRHHHPEDSRRGGGGYADDNDDADRRSYYSRGRGRRDDEYSQYDEDYSRGDYCHGDYTPQTGDDDSYMQDELSPLPEEDEYYLSSHSRHSRVR
jgi:hypothetical protein